MSHLVSHLEVHTSADHGDGCVGGVVGAGRVGRNLGRVAKRFTFAQVRSLAKSLTEVSGCSLLEIELKKVSNISCLAWCNVECL